MSSILRGSYRPSVYGGTFKTITNKTYHATRPSGLDILMEAVSPNAFYDSDNRPDPPKCHPNTRVAVINKIVDWATGETDTDASILWLYGPAGAGKTAIARKVAELFAENGLLLASFLFFRSDPKRNTMKPLVANIAYRVTFVILGAREPINTVIEADPLILSYSVEMQLMKLVFEPLRLLVDQGYFANRQFPRLIVIDGLDECLDKDSQTNLIQLLSSSVARYQLPLKFLIVSRPESHIRSAVAIAGEESTISHLELNNDFLPDEDIRCFLTAKFHEIKRCHPFRSGIPSFWPSEQQMDTLIRKACGQFIYASLAVRFINSTCNSPMRQLDIVLELRPPINHDLPFAELDTLYTFILSCTKSLDLVLHILGVYDILKKGSDKDALEFVEFMLGLEDGDVCIYLSPLNSLLEVQEWNGNREIRFHHSSFMDFLYSPERSKDYCIDAQKSHFLIAQWMLQLFTSDNPSACRQVIDERWFKFMDLLHHLAQSLWIIELEHALERFSIRNYLNWLDQQSWSSESWSMDDEFPEGFLYYLESKGKSGLYRHHCQCYLEHVTSSIDSPPTREKFYLMGTVAFLLRELFPQRGLKLARWKKFCVTLVGFNSGEIKWELWDDDYKPLIDPPSYKDIWDICTAKHGNFAETKRIVPEPIQSHRLAHVAISCMKYLRRRDSNTPPKQDHFLARWATRSKQSPWLWRRRMRVTSMGGRKPIWSRDGQDFYHEKRISYRWTLDLLYHALPKAMNSDELTRALSKPIIPSLAPLLFPRRVKRIRKAAAAYLEKFSSKRVFLTGRDATKTDMKQNIDHMLDVIYSPTGAEGNLRTDFVNGAHTVDKAIKDLQRRFDDMEQRNQQQYQATQLQLAMIRSSFNTVTTTISGLEDQMVNTQRKNLSDLKTNKLMLQTKLLFETNPSQRELIAGLLENTEEETKQLESILANTSREFLMILRGPIAN